MSRQNVGIELANVGWRQGIQEEQNINKQVGEGKDHRTGGGGVTVQKGTGGMDQPLWEKRHRLVHVEAQSMCMSILWKT